MLGSSSIELGWKFNERNILLGVVFRVSEWLGRVVIICIIELGGFC